MRIILVQFLLLISIMISKFILIPQFFKNFQYIHIVLLILVAIFTYVFLGIVKRHSKFKIPTIQIIIIYVLMFFIIYNLFGLIVGFVKTPYLLQFFKIISNILPLAIIIVLEEVLRHSLVTNSKKKFFLVLTCLLFIINDIAMSNQSLTFVNANQVFEFIGLYLFPIISKNILLTYLVFKVGYESSIVYRLLTELPVYIVPVVPDYNVYIESLIRFLFPILLLLKLFFAYEKSEVRRPGREIFKKRDVIILPIIFVLLVIVSLTSGVFKYKSVVIMSDSMLPNFVKGDVIIYDKLNKDEVIKEKDIIVFKRNDKIIVHRVHDIIKKNNQVFYETKGDNNDSVDVELVSLKDIKGISVLVLPFIGNPTVWIYEWLNDIRE